MAASSTIVLKYAKPGTKPPVYLAGSFTNPQWTPLPMEWYTTNSDEYEFHKEVTVQHGHEYQYKFRIGEGEWWILNEDSPTVTDDAGNKNNLLTGPYEYKEPNKDLESSSRPISRTPTLNTRSSNMASKQEPTQPIGGGDAPASPKNENIPVAIHDNVNGAETAIREKYDASPTPSKIEAVAMAATAAEVADVAATLDKPPQIDIDKFDDDDFDDDDSLDAVPLFSHECQLPPDEESFEKPSSSHSQEQATDFRESPFEEVTYDPNDPNIEEFPIDREAIFERIRRTSRSLKEDETSVDLEPQSPVVGLNHHNEHLNLLAPSPHMLPSKHDERSPSLDAIPEEHDTYRGEILASLPEAIEHANDEASNERVTNGSDPSFPIQPVSTELPKQDGKHISPRPIELPETPFIEGDTREFGGDGTQDVNPESPNIIVSPATPGPSTTNQNIDTANATAIQSGNGHDQLKHRKENAQSISLPVTPPSSKPSIDDDTTDNVFTKFFKLVFVEWLGGFITRFCGGGRNSLLAITALVLLLVTPALYLSV